MKRKQNVRHSPYVGPDIDPPDLANRQTGNRHRPDAAHDVECASGTCDDALRRSSGPRIGRLRPAARHRPFEPPIPSSVE